MEPLPLGIGDAGLWNLGLAIDQLGASHSQKLLYSTSRGVGAPGDSAPGPCISAAHSGQPAGVMCLGCVAWLHGQGRPPRGAPRHLKNFKVASDGGSLSQALLVIKLHLQHVPQVDLRHVVHDELVVQQVPRRPLRLCAVVCFTRGHGHAIQVLVPGGVRHHLALAVRRLVARWGLLHVLCPGQTVRCPQRHVRQQHEPRVVDAVCVAVVGTFGDHVSEVDSLPEHVPGHRRFGRCNSQALRNNTHEVG
mmetsp:Transcript_7261/g.13828  ORF Transcript_7261/g.13828 Transcript_7261/m.13828 type:complete len:249 (+) Transcript_7261:1389-2135(+)